MGTMNKRKPHVFTTEIMENTIFLGKILIFGFRNIDFDRSRLAALQRVKRQVWNNAGGHWIISTTC